jgi:Fe2+ transport system protein FeoA
LSAPLQAPSAISVDPSRSLTELRLGEQGIVESIDLPEGDSRRLMELGFLPGAQIQYVRRSPFGDPRVFLVDGSEVALRRETALHILLLPSQR